MAQTIYADSDLVSEELIYGRRSFNLIESIGQGIGQYTEVLTDAGAAFMNRSREVFERFSGHEAIQSARRALRGLTGFMTPDEIVLTDTVELMQMAKPQMQRALMADPMARRMFYNNQIEGYADTYVDREPGRIGLDHYDYRIMTDGLVQEEVNEEGDVTKRWVTHTFQEIRNEELDRFHTTQVFDMARSRARLRQALTRKGEDPTSKFGAML